jgi:hypothetical protein
VLGAEPAILLVLHAAGLFLLVLRGGIVPPLAVGALEGDNVSHTISGYARAVNVLVLLLELATGIEPVTSSLPRKCSTN